MWLGNDALVALLMAIVSMVTVHGSTEEEKSTSVTVKGLKVINHIAKEFVCFSAKPRSVFENSVNPVSETTFRMAKNLGPMYLKVYGDSSQLELQMEKLTAGEEDTELVQITPNGWRAFDKWVQEAGLVPVFVLDYSGDYWKPKSALKVLTVANTLGITNCLWQLGTGNITNVVKYVEDLRVFRTIANAFKYKGVVACDVDPMTVGLDQSRYFNLNVDELADAVSVTYDPSINENRLREFVLQKEAYVRGPARSHLPVWLEVSSSTTTASSGESCNDSCLRDGLHYATLLGDAARNGFHTVFKTLSRQEVQSYSLTYIIGLLHKTTIGTKVFDLPRMPEHGVQIYAYCGRVGNGSLSLMAINHEPDDFQFDIELKTRQQSVEVEQYVITVVDEVIQLNDKPFYFESNLSPLVIPRPIPKGLQLIMPAEAIAFWVIPNLNLRECFDDYQELQTKVARSVTVLESSVDQLLQELIAEQAEQHHTVQINRQKRSVDTEQMDDALGMLDETEMQKGPKTKGNRSPRQTLNYRRKQRTVRLKEKRAERKQLKQQKRPLRERGKRQSKKRQRCANPAKITVANKKTKRSSLAEAVNQPPTFGDSYEEQINRSSFPEGDVHLIISKVHQEDDPSIIQWAPIRENNKEHQRKTQKKIPTPEKDFTFLTPEVAIIKDQAIVTTELETAASDHHQVSLDEPNENVTQSVVAEEIKTGAPLVKRQDFEAFDDLDDAEQEGNDYENGEEQELSSTSTSREDTGSSYHSLGDSPEIDRSVVFSDEGDSEDSSGSDDERHERRKRSLSSFEINQPEAFSSNGTTWAEELQDLIKSYADQSKSVVRVKRNALWHPRSSESRTNFLHQQRTSEESKENMILNETNTLKEVQQIRDALLASRAVERSTTEVSGRTTTPSSIDDAERLTILAMRSVSQFVKKMSNEFNRILSRWLPKAEE